MSRELPYNKGLVIGQVAAVDYRNAQIQISLTSDLSARDGISIGDLDKNDVSPKSAEDPRQGFMIKKMFIHRKICDKAGAGDVVTIPAAFLFDNDTVPNTGDSVYKTYDDLLQRELSETIPAFEEGQPEAIVSKTYQNTTKPDGSAGACRPRSSSESFPLAELIEKLSPSKPLKINASFSCQIQAGAPILLTAADDSGMTITMQSEYAVEAAQKNPLSKEQAIDLLSKVGGTIYQITSVTVSITGDCFVPVGELKTIRNKALQALLTARAEKKHRPREECGTSTPPPALSLLPFAPPAQVSVCVYSGEDLNAALKAGADRVYISQDIFKCPITNEEFGIPLRRLKSVLSIVGAHDLDKIFFKTSFVTKESDFKDLEEVFLVLRELGVSNILASNLGVYEYLSNPCFSDFKIAADAPFNIFNADAASVFVKAGAVSVTLSPELSIDDIAALSRGFVSKNNSLPAFEAAVHGRQRLMVTEHPLLESVLKGGSFSNKSFNESERSVAFDRYVLKDTKEFSFPILSDTTGRCFIFNSKELSAYDLLPNLKAAGVSIFRIDGIGHTPDEIFDLVSLYKKGLAEAAENQTDGQGGVRCADGAEFTKGNFIRGVE